MPLHTVGQKYFFLMELFDLKADIKGFDYEYKLADNDCSSVLQ